MTRAIKQVGLALAALILLLPDTCWAHGAMQGLGAVLVVVFVGGPMVAILLVLGIVLIVLLAKHKHNRGARIYARIVQGLAICFQVLLPLAAWGIERNNEALIVGGLSFGGLLLFSGGTFALAQVLARRCLRARAVEVSA